MQGQSYINKDIQLQTIKTNDEGPLRIITQTPRSKSTLIRTENERKWLDMRQDYEDTKLNHLKDLCNHTNRNLIKHIDNTENLDHISSPNSQVITLSTKFQKNAFAKPLYCYVKLLLIFIFICTCIGLLVFNYLNGVNIRQAFPIVNSSYMSSNSALIEDTISMDSKIHILDRDLSGSILRSSTTLLRPVIVSYLTKSNNIKNPSADKYIADLKSVSFGERTFNQESNDKSEIMSLLGFTSGHQNNFGVPIEEDERILKLLNSKLIQLDQETETALIASQTESSLIVSPTLPLILHKFQESSTKSGLTEEIQCQSTSLYMCRGILQYDLTVATDKILSFTPLELDSFERLFASNCSFRAAEFVCNILEPECRPMQSKSLQPCKRFCKSLLEACSTLIITSDILTYIFDCDKYPDSNDNNVCEDPTRRGACHESEFKCYDLSCIPRKWVCDNIKDCEGGDDETNCLICQTNEFRCKSNEKCLLDQYRCDLKEDCSDGSDEQDCESKFESEIPRVISFPGSLQHNFTDRGLFNTIFDDDRLPAESELNESVMSTTTKANLTGGDRQEINVKSDTEKNYNINRNDQTGKKNKTVSISFPTSCINDQLRCVSGKCITVNQLCDRVVDCPEGEDEIMCNYHEDKPHT